MSWAMAPDDGLGHGEARAAPEAERADAEPGLILAAEAAGSGLLAFLAVAAGILGERLAIHNVGLALLITALAGASAFFVLARSLRGLAPSFFNPALALASILAGRMSLSTGLIRAGAQIAAAFLGVMLAHLVTNTGLVQVASQIQTGEGVWLGEFLASTLFVFAMLTAAQASTGSAALTGALCLFACALATPSTSLANPALTLARALTDSFLSIRLSDALLIAAIQMIAAIAAWAAYRWLYPAPSARQSAD
jgi:glycerol uptake facilitator-like aquaporin